MKISIDHIDILYLTIAFTVLALYYDIHRQHHILEFILNHLISLIIALLISRFIIIYIDGNISFF